MLAYNFPALTLEELRPTLESLQIYAKVIGKVRRAMTPKQKHWWHVSLSIAGTGFTTSPIPAGALIFELLLDLITHQLVISTSRGDRRHLPLTGQAAATFCEQTLAALADMGLKPEIDRSLFTETVNGVYDRHVAEKYWQALLQTDSLFKQFKGELREESGPVVLWPHHIDLALLWFSGRLVSGMDPADEENADEQMNFGFSPGDEGIPQPYFYITAYPLPIGLIETQLPAGTYWHTLGFTGAIMPYQTLVGADNPDEKLLTFLRTVQKAGATLMANS